MAAFALLVHRLWVQAHKLLYGWAGARQEAKRRQRSKLFLADDKIGMEDQTLLQQLSLIAGPCHARPGPEMRNAQPADARLRWGACAFPAPFLDDRHEPILVVSPRAQRVRPCPDDPAGEVALPRQVEANVQLARPVILLAVVVAHELKPVWAPARPEHFWPRVAKPYHVNVMEPDAVAQLDNFVDSVHLGSEDQWALSNVALIAFANSVATIKYFIPSASAACLASSSIVSVTSLPAQKLETFSTEHAKLAARPTALWPAAAVSSMRPSRCTESNNTRGSPDVRPCSVGSIVCTSAALAVFGSGGASSWGGRKDCCAMLVSAWDGASKHCKRPELQA
eukprot:CAMPEP_0117498902 /NCGR_PEP_ID=MMETSP0784-20121206/21959_1 /TAXON_ID=39447 /ORGANISM="" /LENGTH=337 /DNA_ID=CAMNT_0005294013 /DNA_START=182 /DNA_END=1196 /DNA_ORIENTATION=-